MSYRIVTLPLIATSRLTKLEQKYATEYFEKFGSKSFAPENVELAKTILKEKTCTFLYLVFKNLLKFEHELGLHFVSKKEADRLTKIIALPTPPSLRTKEEWKREGCKSQLSPETTNSIIRDIYSNRDNSNVFGHLHPEYVYGPLHQPLKIEELWATEPESKEFIEEEEKRCRIMKSKYDTCYSQDLETKECKSIEEDYKDYCGSILKEYFNPVHFPKPLQPIYDRIFLDHYVHPRGKDNTAVILLSPDYTYLGHIYVWPYSSELHVMGIRKSINELLCRTTPFIAENIFAAVILYAKLHGYTQISLVRPLDHLEKLVRPLGFSWGRIVGKTFSEVDMDVALAALEARKLKPTITNYGCDYFSDKDFSLEDNKEIKNFASELLEEYKREPPLVVYSLEEGAGPEIDQKDYSDEFEFEQAVEMRNLRIANHEDYKRFEEQKRAEWFADPLNQEWNDLENWIQFVKEWVAKHLYSDWEDPRASSYKEFLRRKISLRGRLKL